MKKEIVFAMCFAMFALSGCNIQRSAVIGGTDGPTDIYVSDNNISYEREPIRMVKIDGDLYYETGEDTKISGRCGNMDGNFRKAVGKYELPQNDNESNFGDGDGYQRINDTIEILIDDDWEIFTRIYADGVEEFKYCYKLEIEEEHLGEDVDYLVISNKKDVTPNEALDFLSSINSEKSSDMFVMPIDD